MYIYIYIHTYIHMYMYYGILSSCAIEKFRSVWSVFWFAVLYTLFLVALQPFLTWRKTPTTWRKIRSGPRETRFQYFVYVQVSYTCTKLYANVCLCMLHVYAYVYKHLYNNEVSITYSCKNPMHLQHFNGQRIAISPWWIERFVEVSSLSSKWRRISTPAAGGRSAALPSSAAGNPAMAEDFFGI